jgi:hypothetical protein
MPTQLYRSAQTLKKLQSTAREAIRAVLELERVLDSDLFGQYVLAEGEVIDDEIAADVVEFLRIAREYYPTQQLDFIVIAHVA